MCQGRCHTMVCLCHRWWNWEGPKRVHPYDSRRWGRWWTRPKDLGASKDAKRAVHGGTAGLSRAAIRAWTTWRVEDPVLLDPFWAYNQRVDVLDRLVILCDSSGFLLFFWGILLFDYSLYRYVSSELEIQENLIGSRCILYFFQLKNIMFINPSWAKSRNSPPVQRDFGKKQ